MPGDPGVTVVTTLVCYLHTAHEAAGASGARHSLRPLIGEGGTSKAKLARNARRDREAVSERRLLLSDGVDGPRSRHRCAKTWSLMNATGEEPSMSEVSTIGLDLAK